MLQRSAARLEQVQRACQEVRAAYPLAGLVVTVAYDQETPNTIILGSDEHGVPLAQASLFPVASVTKLAVALAILRLGDMGRLSVGDPLGRYVPEAAAAQHGVILKQLLTHTAGLPDPDITYDEHLSWPVSRQVCLDCVPITQPGTQVRYVNSGYGLLGIVLEHLQGTSLQTALDDLVFRPLEIEAYLGVEPTRLPAAILDPADPNAGTSIEMWNSPFFRSLGEPWGGLITTPAGAFSLFRAFLGHPAGFLHPGTQRAAIRDQTGGVGGGFAWQTWDHCPWGLGPELIAANMNHWVFPGANGGTVCLGGYSGCVIFADQAKHVVWSIHGTRSAADPWFSHGIPMISTAVLASAT